jgi:hypothetical protein
MIPMKKLVSMRMMTKRRGFLKYSFIAGLLCVFIGMLAISAMLAGAWVVVSGESNPLAYKVPGLGRSSPEAQIGESGELAGEDTTGADDEGFDAEPDNDNEEILSEDIDGNKDNSSIQAARQGNKNKNGISLEGGTDTADDTAAGDVDVGGIYIMEGINAGDDAAETDGAAEADDADTASDTEVYEVWSYDNAGLYDEIWSYDDANSIGEGS